MKDKEIQKLINQEATRQQKDINLIPSENIVSPDVLEALSSCFINKYAEGYPRARYYQGNRVVDELERLCQTRALKLFNLSPRKWHVNVQALSGSPANLAIFNALVNRDEKIMGMNLSDGGHLSHGHKVSITGRLWKQISYGVDHKTERINYDELMNIALQEQPKIIIAGYTAYPRKIDFKKFRNIADACGAYLLVDMSHVAGLIAVGLFPSPFRYADVVMTTTHKTLRGPRHALIFCDKLLAEKIDKSLFPGLQGGPHMNTIAATAVALYEASQPKFKQYIAQVVENAKVLSEELKTLGWKIVSNGTDTHLILINTWGSDVKNGKGLSGKMCAELLEEHGIIVNKNTIPFDTRSPLDPSGIRLGTPMETTKGKREKDMVDIARKIDKVLRA